MRATVFALRSLKAILATLLFIGIGVSAERDEPASDSTLTWMIQETPNFRIWSKDKKLAGEVFALCEPLRSEIGERWFEIHPYGSWIHRCELIIHPDHASYARSVGNNGTSSAIAILAQTANGEVTARRIDLDPSAKIPLRESFARELTRVVLADLLTPSERVRWLDEGLARLASQSQGSGHSISAIAIDEPKHVRISDLLSGNDGPLSHQSSFPLWSASLTEYFLAKGSPGKLIQFARSARREGFECAVRRAYGINGIAELERDWNAKRLAIQAKSVAAQVCADRRSQ